MSLNKKKSDSNFYTAETYPGSGIYHLCYKDAAIYYRKFSYGFFLEMDAAVPEHFYELIKSQIKYGDFPLGKPLLVRKAMGEANWRALPKGTRVLLSRFKLVKVEEALIHLLPL